MSFTASGSLIRATGDIVPGDGQKFKTFLAGIKKPGQNQPGPSTLVLESPGGTLITGIELGTITRQAGLATKVLAGGTCASACAYFFLGGVIREVEGSGRLGVHMASASGTDSYISRMREILINAKLSIDDKLRVIVLLAEQRSAQVANDQAAFIIKMGVSLKLLQVAVNQSHFDIHWLTRAELRDLNVVNVD